MGVTISGTITNTDAQPLRCNAIAFLLVDARGDALAPATHFCDMPAIAPNDSGYFSATFDPRTTDDLHLRFQHPDGSYETHDVIVPPA